MKILISKEADKAFIVNAGNRYQFLCYYNGNEWIVKGGHLWQTGSPRIPRLGDKLYWNPNTGEYNGEWVRVYENFFKGTHNDYTPKFAADCWQAWQKSKNVKKVKVTKRDKERWLYAMDHGGLTLDTIGLGYLYDKYDTLRMDIPAKEAWAKALETV